MRGQDDKPGSGGCNSDLYNTGSEFDLGWIGRSTGRAERRQVVVLAVGFERLTNTDPEAIVEALAGRRDFVAQIVLRYGVRPYVRSRP